MSKTPQTKSINYEIDYLPLRSIVPFGIPNSFDGNMWRTIARSQPIVMNVISNLTMYIHSLPYEIRARNPMKREKLKKEIEYHREILETAQDGAGFQVYLELLLEDFNTIPFGGATETVRYDDGRLYKILAVDGATFMPYFDGKYVAYQISPKNQERIFFTDEELKRIYRFPRPEIKRKGWGMTPLERVYLAVEMLTRGDSYYAKMLLDTPEAGILDLVDMSEESAKKWLESFKLMFLGLDPLKIPVLYEHNNPAKYIPFGRAPSELVFDDTILKYAQIVAGAWGLTLSDIGMTSINGNSLAGAIRDERKSRSTGYATVRKYVESHINSILPKELEFVFIDVDYELLVSRGRARSANAVAGKNLIDSGVVSPQVWFRQMIDDGLITTSTPEEFQNIREELKAIEVKDAKVKMVGGSYRDDVFDDENVLPSQGGMGEVKKSLVSRNRIYISDLERVLQEKFLKVLEKATRVRLRKLVKESLKNNLQVLRAVYEEKETEEEKQFFFEKIYSYYLGYSSDLDEMVSRAFDENLQGLNGYFERDKWYLVEEEDDDDVLVYLLALLVSEGLFDSAKEIYEKLYEADKINSPDVRYKADISKIKGNELFRERLKSFYENINSGTVYFLKRAASGVIYDVEKIDELRKILDDEDPLSNQMLLDYLTDRLESEFRTIMMERTKVISETERWNFYNLGYYLQGRKVNARKFVEHIGVDIPCDICTENINLGVVDIDYEYVDKFGGFAKTPVFHPECHCVIRLNVDNIEGEIELWE